MAEKNIETPYSYCSTYDDDKMPNSIGQSPYNRSPVCLTQTAIGVYKKKTVGNTWT